MWVRRRLGVPDVPAGCAPEDPALAGLAAGLEFVIGSGPLAVATYLGELAETLRRKLSAVPHVRVCPPPAGKAHAPIVSLTVDRLASQAVASRLHTESGVICAAGEHAAPYLHGPLGTATTGTVRFSPGPFNTVEDLDHAVAALKEVSQQRAPAAA
jgi:selenocysteine lyase/cysteine desulfurase